MVVSGAGLLILVRNTQPLRINLIGNHFTDLSDEMA